MWYMHMITSMVMGKEALTETVLALKFVSVLLTSGLVFEI